MKRVDFFVVGAQRAGTTALFEGLCKTPGVQMSSTKEPHVFDDPFFDESVDRISDLHTRFDWSVDSVCRGEATPSYCFVPSAIPRIARYNPDARIIMLLRDPVSRAMSHWSMQTARGLELRSFEQAVHDELAGNLQGADHISQLRYSYVARGNYSGQCERILEYFSRDQVWFGTVPLLGSDSIPTTTAISKFLGVGELRLPAVRVRSAPTIPIPPQSSSTLARLREYYLDDLRRTRKVTGVDVSIS